MIYSLCFSTFNTLGRCLLLDCSFWCLSSFLCILFCLKHLFVNFFCIFFPHHFKEPIQTSNPAGIIYISGWMEYSSSKTLSTPLSFQLFLWTGKTFLYNSIRRLLILRGYRSCLIHPYNLKEYWSALLNAFNKKDDYSQRYWGGAG